MGILGSIVPKVGSNACIGLVVGKKMDERSQSPLPNHLVGDDKGASEAGENDSTVSTIDSHMLHSSNESSPQLSPLHGYHYLSRENAQLRVPVATGIRPEVVSTIDGPNFGSFTSGAIVEIVPSAACSVSTAPSTADEASSLGMDSTVGCDYFRHRGDSTYLGTGGALVTNSQSQSHHRIPSWDLSPRQQAYGSSNPHSFSGNRSNPGNNMNAVGIEHGFPPLPPQQLQQNPAWTSHTSRVHQQSPITQQHPQSQQQPHQRVAALRGDPQLGYHPASPGSRHSMQQQHWQTQSPPASYRYVAGDSHLPFVSQGTGRSVDNRITYQRPNHNSMSSVHANPTYNSHQMQSPRKHGSYNQHLLPPSSGTPSRSANRDTVTRVFHGRSEGPNGNNPVSNPKTTVHGITSSPRRIPSSNQQNATVGQQASQGSNSRSSSEVLKTLLRKKACLYEPDTSRAVALVTWLVGKELALEYGYFSRQQLQAGVHACVTSKIESGVITRTKVNRCMQIILNSCFHYIIPRPDGTEENGEVFREMFAKEMLKDNTDPEHLLNQLPVPWNDITINRDDILHASSVADDASVAGKKEVDIVTPSHSPRLGSMSEANSPVGKEIHIDGDGGGESKRAVLLCFNENVRKAEDVFRCHNEFIRDTAHASNLQLSSTEWIVFFGQDAPNLWGNIGIPIPFVEEQGLAQKDALGVFSSEELAAFRTSWCSKRYDHNHDLCGFAHAEVNNGWLRRNPADYSYLDEICPHLTTIEKRQNNLKLSYVINECPHGVDCRFAHSIEEILYHSKKYKKSKICSFTGRAGGCPFGDVCPNFHPADFYRFPKKSDARSPRHSRHQSHGNSGSNKGSAYMSNSCIPCGTPVLYASPAPFSSFEQQLMMPGLQNLFRRQCSVVRSFVKNAGQSATCFYHLFGDDAGIDVMADTKSPSSSNQSDHFHRQQMSQAAERTPAKAFVTVYKTQDNLCDHVDTNSVG